MRYLRAQHHHCLSIRHNMPSKSPLSVQIRFQMILVDKKNAKSTPGLFSCTFLKSDRITLFPRPTTCLFHGNPRGCCVMIPPRLSWLLLCIYMCLKSSYNKAIEVYDLHCYRSTLYITISFVSFQARKKPI